MKKQQKTQAKKIEKKAVKKVEKKPEPKVENKAVQSAPAPVQAPAPKIPDFKIRPLGDRILIKEDSESKEEKTASGIIIPVSAQEDKGGRRGVVITFGPGRVDDGVLVPVNVKAGDKVLFQWGDKIQVDGEEYYLVKESEILAVIK